VGSIYNRISCQFPTSHEVARLQASELHLDLLQEVTVTTVQPLRVNLPLRGQRHVFTQVLQTEVNEPMTVEFAARNLKAGGWLKPIVLTLGAFLVL